MSRNAIDHEIDIGTLRPLRDYALVEVFERTKTYGGLYLVKSKATPCVFGRVLRVGSGVEDQKTGVIYPLELERGEIVLFMDYAQDGGRIEQPGGKRYALIRSNGLWATVAFKDQESYEIKTITPRMDMLLVEPYDEARTKGGLHLPRGQDVESGLRRARVVAVGPGMWESGTEKRRPVESRPGEWVLMTRFAGAEIVVEGVEYRIINESDVQCEWEG